MRHFVDCCVLSWQTYRNFVQLVVHDVYRIRTINPPEGRGIVYDLGFNHGFYLSAMIKAHPNLQFDYVGVDPGDVLF